MAKEFVPIFYDWLETTQDLSLEEKGKLIDAVVSYSAGLEYEHMLTGGCLVAFRFMKGQVDRNTAISKTRSRAGACRKESAKEKADPEAEHMEPADPIPGTGTEKTEGGGCGCSPAEASDIKTEQAKTNESKTEQTQANESKPKQTKANESKTEQTKAKTTNNNNNKNENKNESKNENENEDGIGCAGASACASASASAGAAVMEYPEDDTDARREPIRIRGQDAAPLREIEDRFDRFWAAYPRKEAKQKAHTAFLRLKPDEEMLQGMLKAIARQKTCDQWQEAGGKFVPHPTTWLNGRRWEDEPPKAGSGPGTTVLAQRYSQRDYSGAQETPEQMLARLMAAQKE